MSRKTKIPAIGSIPSGIDARLRSVLQAIKEALEIQVGQRGDDLDKAVTFRDLTDSNMIEIPAAGVSTSGSTIIPVTNPGDLSTPPTAYSLTANGSFTNVILSWQGGFRHPLVGATEIYRHTSDDLNSASHIGSTSSFIYTDTVEPGSTHYYWVRFRSTSDVAGPFNSTSGTVATTSKKVSELIDDLSDSIGTSQLSTALSTQISGYNTSITSHQNVINGISAEKYIKLDVNGAVSGYGIASGASGSEFAVLADVFKISNGTSASPTIPFAVVGGVVYMRSAMIQDASIDVAKIGNLTVTMAQVTGTLTANKIDAGLITSDKISAAGISADKITIDGNIEFANTASGVQFGKTSLGDSQAGAFFGRSGGVAGFSISSSTSGIYADSTGQVNLNNVRLYSGVAGSAAEFPNTGTYTRNISASTSAITVIIIGGGGGSSNNASGTLGGGISGSAGTASYIKWYSGQNGTGSVLGTYTAAGGAGLVHGQVASNISGADGLSGLASSKAAGGAGGSGNPASNTTGNGTFGSGGGGGGGTTGSGNRGNAPVTGRAAAGSTVSQVLQKPSGAQSIKIFVGTGGTGGAGQEQTQNGQGDWVGFQLIKGGNGGNGFVSYADPNGGGTEIDLTDILSRLNALEA